MSEWSGISASGAGAAILCPTRLALPQVRTTTEAAERGNYLHEFARLVTVNPACREAALLEIPEQFRHTASGMNLDAALDGLTVIGCERAYALDVKARTVRFIGENIGRNYERDQPLGRYEVPYTMDVEALIQLGGHSVPAELDFKSGQSIGDPAEHWQRRICASGLMLFRDTATAISRVAYIWEDGRIVPDGTEFSIIDVEDFCDTLVATIDAVHEARAMLAEGRMPTIYPSDEACAYCPAMLYCPQFTNFAKAMLGKLQAVEKGPELSSLSLEELGAVWTMAKTAEKIVENLLPNLKKIAEEKPLPVGPDHEIRPLTKSKKRFDQSKARGLITVLLGRLGVEDEEIQSQLEKLQVVGEYQEFRKQRKAS